MIKRQFAEFEISSISLILRDRMGLFLLLYRKMSLKLILSFTVHYIRFFSKGKLINAFLTLREKYFALANRNNELEEENKRLKDKLLKLSVKEVNFKVNQPTSILRTA